MYTIYDQIEKKIARKVDSWEELINIFRADSIFDSCGYANTSDIAHNENDVKAYVVRGDLERLYYVYKQRRYIIFDEFDRIINKVDIEEGIKNTTEKTVEPYFLRRRIYRGTYEYRKDPVPYTGGRHYSYYRSVVKRNKIYYSRLQDWIRDHSEDSRIRKMKHHVISWRDDFNTNKQGKSWKKQKKRKQWM